MPTQLVVTLLCQAGSRQLDVLTPDVSTTDWNLANTGLLAIVASIQLCAYMWERVCMCVGGICSVRASVHVCVCMQCMCVCVRECVRGLLCLQNFQAAST